MTKKHITRKKVLFVLAAIFSVIVLAAAVAVILPLTETVDGYCGENAQSWMAELPDDITISEVVLPGTHDSATQYVHLGLLAKCQALSVEEQLAAGFRYFDLRVEATDKGLKMKHGFLDCQTGAAPWSPALYADKLFSDFRFFLSEHPTEFIVLSVKQEHGDKTPETIEGLIALMCNLDGEYLLVTDTLPAVGEARGKIVILRRYEDEGNLGAAGGLPFLWDDQGNRDQTDLAAASQDQGNYLLTVQDRYKYDCDDKRSAFLDTLIHTGETGSVGKPALTVNFLSTNGNTAYGHPYRYAKELNKWFMTLEDRELSGWIIIDFGSGRMAEKIYSANFHS